MKKYFATLIKEIRKRIVLLRKMLRDRKTHRYFKCNKCGAWLKVARRKGRVSFTCPVCNNKLIKKT